MVVGWKVAHAVSERIRFMLAWLSGEERVTGLAARFGVSRKTAYKWIGQYKAKKQ
jgi:putative transposase